MESTIRVKQDLDRNEPLLQLRLSGFNYDSSADPDMRDEVLKHFTELANQSLIYVYYGGAGNCLPQLRVLNPETTPEVLMQFVIDNFAMFARPFFQATEMDNVEAFFGALKTKVMLKAKVKDNNVSQKPYEPEVPISGSKNASILCAGMTVYVKSKTDQYFYELTDNDIQDIISGEWADAGLSIIKPNSIG